ncbi:hypothetical protein K2X33_12730 [bacterium]|nr:hypothetical protein [bacterium]
MTSNRTIKWIESLAEQEVSIQSGDRLSIDLYKTKDEVLSVETSTFVRDLYYHVDYLIRLFNLRVVEEAMQLRLAKQGEGDAFGVTRGDMRLTVSTTAPGVIQFACEKLLDPNLGPRSSVMFSGGIEAQFGLFHEVDWSCLGNKVIPEQVARHYLTEFIQVSRPGKSAT